MKLAKKILLGLFIVFIAMQFIRPARNVNGQVLPTDITKTVAVPDKVMNILKISCYDCHSNNTRYPWYMNVEPMGWLMASHIKEGKANFNFSEFGSYSKRKGANKLRAVGKTTKEGTMPISSYTMMHSDSKLSQMDKNLLMEWASAAKDSMDLKQ